MPHEKSTRTRIVETALDEMSKGGLATLSIGHLAKACSMSKSGLFAHFGGQEALQVCVIEAAIEQFRQQVVEPARQQSGTLARIEALGTNWTGWLLRDPSRPCPILQAAFEAPALTPKAAELARQARRGWTDWVERLAKLAIHEGGFAATTDAKRFAFQFEAIGVGCQSWSVVQGRDEAGRLARASFTALIDSARA
ncbi:TetR family transcriptional regulator [Glycocaulis alkaliphilus]|uniref:TetR family transcriptional regulator n=1 Tax=Glycocaulis alkaliphilus TaxID=1434191 RepID=A0A3T0E9G4_9PROT|nr:TetR/AcrR family transcriptional regulator [Glycocaulis alkaliphilus]AZU03912.1 TetR family transcriptional regulator [Glycocaulis alkaliphilus]GGB86003.1 TetR family transcriptional regulator [Glycocaulis alkaliphilus]